MSRESIRHPRTSMPKHGCQLAVFMITWHKGIRIWIYTEKMENYDRTLFGVAYVSRVENQAKRSSYLLIVVIFLKFLWSC